MTGRPSPDEAAPFYSGYINQAVGDDPLVCMSSQLDKEMSMLRSIGESQSLHRYAPKKWSIRQVLNHVTDTERAFCFRALWFGRGFQDPLPRYDPDLSAAGAEADLASWTAHLEEFVQVRLATIAFYQNLPTRAWMKTGLASGNRFTVRSLAWIIPGHFAHHIQILRDRYL